MSFLLLLLKKLMTSLGVCLARLFVKRKVLQDKVLFGHHNLRQPPRNDGEDVWLGLPDNRKQVPGRDESLVVSFTGNDLEQLVQTNKRSLLHPLDQTTPLILTYTSRNIKY